MLTDMIQARPDNANANAAWTDVCAVDDILPDTGVCARVEQRHVATVQGEGLVLQQLQQLLSWSKVVVDQLQ